MRTFTYAVVILLLCIAPSRAYSATHYITDAGTGDYPTIQAAIIASSTGDTIILADGTYTGAGNWDIDLGGKNVVVRSENGRSLCVIDCGDGLSGQHRAFHFHSGEDSTSVIEEITIRDGYLEALPGAGILIENGSDPTVSNCYINGCRAMGSGPDIAYGGGIAIFDSSPRIVGNSVYTNTALSGGGIYLAGSSAVITGNDIYSNSATDGGAGIYSFESTPAIVNNWFDSNSGGGMALINYVVTPDDAVMQNNLITHNTGPGQGLLWGVQAADAPSITGCTFFNNSGGGILLNDCSGNITDCILYSNGSTEISAGGTPVSYCWVEGGYTGTGNITGTSIDWDYGVYAEIYLPEGNECLDAGSSAASGICLDTQAGERCLSQMSALQSERPDTGQVDIGYHYLRQRKTLYVPDDVATIQGAIESSVDGDRVEVGGDPMIMHGPVDFLGKAVHVISVGAMRRISGGNSQTAVRFVSGETSSSILENFNIYYGSATNGGGMLVGGPSGSSPQIINCGIYECWGRYGGGVYVGSQCSPYFFSFVISDCDAEFGGGIYSSGGSAEFVTGEVRGCEAYLGGGGFLSYEESTFDDVHFSRNTATGYVAGSLGGGMFMNQSQGTFDNCSFTNNIAQEKDGISNGGALYIEASYFVPGISHCTIAGNTALLGAGIYYFSGGGLEIDNSIVAFNIGGEPVYCDNGTEVTFSCSDVYNNDGGDWTGCLAGQDSLGDNFSADPVFRDLLNDMPTVAETSPCAAGNNPSCGWVGALDFSHPLATVTVNPGGGGTFATIQDAISSFLISGGDTIYLGDGVFTGPGNVDIDLEGKSVILRSLGGDPEDCVIDCQGSSGSPHRGFNLSNREGHAARIEGITVRNGWTGGAGGGINMSRSDATIKNCLFEKCHAYDGGGIIAFFGEGLIWTCGFDSCTADDAGGGLFLSGGDPVVRDCWFKENWANWGGGGMYNDDSSPLIERCTFAGNTSAHMGGGIHNNHSECEPEIRNCTFSMNAGLNGGAIFSRNFAAPVVYNSIIAFSPDGVAVRVQTDATTTLYCCDVYGNVDGDYVDAILGQDGINGNFSEDPLFCNVYTHYLRLDEASPCTQENGGGCGLIGAIWEGCHTLTDAGEDEVLPSVTRLYSCYPNPFNPCTRISFDIGAPCQVYLKIFDVAGRLVRTLVDEHRRSGRFEEIWDGRDDRGGKVASGVYFYRLRAAEFVESKKMILLR